MQQSLDSFGLGLDLNLTLMAGSREDDDLVRIDTTPRGCSALQHSHPIEVEQEVAEGAGLSFPTHSY